MKIVVAGYGPVGQAVSTALEDRDDIDLYIDDPYKGKTYPDEYVDTVDAVVVCVATPMSPMGACDISNVMDVFDKYGSDKRYLVKSTTAPNAFDSYPDHDITFSPEYLRGTTGSNPTEEFLNSEFAVYGGKSGRFWHELFLPSLPRLKDVRFMELNQAVFVKYFMNVFLATKVTFFNQAYKILQARGEEQGYDTIIDGLCLDPRVGWSHTQVPGPDGEYGYGGHCFPKDTNALIGIGEEAGADMRFLEFVSMMNDEYRNGID